jgi:hypothetical protein
MKNIIISSRGWSYGPGLKVLQPKPCDAATWMAISPGW